MALSFPSNPTLGQTYSSGSSATYQWNGSYWDTLNPSNITTLQAISSSYTAQSVSSSFATTSSLAQNLVATATSSYGWANIPDNSLTTTNTVYDLVSFSIPSAGVWEIEWNIRYNALNGYGIAWLANNSNAIIDETETMLGYTAISIPGDANIQVTSNFKTFVTTTGATTYKIRGVRKSGSGGISSNTDGRSRVFYRKLGNP